MRYFSNAYYAYTQLILTDIYPIQYGEEQCENGHAFGPCIRNNYLLHYIYSGRGIFKTQTHTYELQKGQMFLICPNQLTYYRADSDNPWLYRWIEFNGSLSKTILNSASISINNPIFTDNAEMTVGTALNHLVQNGDIPFERLMQIFWNFIFSLTQDTGRACLSVSEEYVKRAKILIKNNLHKKITVTDIADYIGINRSYLCRLFQEYEQISPQQYILSLKMNTAALYLKNANISVSEAAQSVGYSDPHIFNKAFKKQFHTSPSLWRQKQIWEQSIK